MEIWKDIEGYDGSYQISDLGRVKSLRRYQKNRAKLIQISERILKENPNEKGYMQVMIYKNGVGKTYKIARIVATTFILNPENKPEVNHINGDKTNNSVGNLEWMTHQENITHGVTTGLCPKGEKVGTSKLKEYEVREIRDIYSKGGISTRKLGKMFKVSCLTIWEIVNNKRWKHLI